MERIDMELSGGCQCGAVRYHTTQILDNAHICHCRMCQKAVGNLFAALVGMPLDKFEWTRGEPTIFMSSEHVARGFCNKCGTPLFYRNINNPRYGITIGSIDTPEKVVPHHQYGNESRLPYFETLASLDGAETTTESDDPDFAASIRRSSHQHPDHDTERWP
jgi:hypothetical protein